MTPAHVGQVRSTRSAMANKTMHNITFVTSNDNKVKEVERILGIKLRRENLDLPEIQAMNLKVIVEHKARGAYNILKKPLMVEDSGMYMDAWKGFPGPFIKWIHDTMGYDIFPTLLPSDNRKVTWRVRYAYCNGKELYSCEGATVGTVAEKERGTDGWGFDTLFIPKGETQTFAEAGPEFKFKYSARDRALKKLKKYLKKQGLYLV